MHRSRKVLAIPRRHRLAAVGLFTMAGSWCGDEETDGVFPSFMLTEWGATDALVAALVKVGLWTNVPDSSNERSTNEQRVLDESGTGMRFSKWAEYQPTRAELLDKRAKTAEKLRNWRGRNQDSNPVTGVVTPPVTNPVTNPVSNPAPDPTRPDPSLKDTLPLTDTPPESARRSAPREPEGFADFWAAYPRKTGKGAARTAYSKALAKGVTPGELTAAADDYTTATSHAKTEERFIPHPATWLGQERWADRPVTTPTTPEPISPWDRVYKTGPDDD